MQDRVEPPILLSRLMTFIFATMIVVVITMIITLYNMFPTNRPQIFFLMSVPKNNLQIVLTEMQPSDENIEPYKRAFIQEYVKARNEIIPNINVMRTKWNNDLNGIVYTWSNQNVYNEFTKTSMWNALMSSIPDFEFSCSVEFDNNAIEPRTNDTYAITFRYFCSDINGQSDKKEYKIKIKLENEKNLKWVDRVNNPLGIRVSEYEILSGNGDPLDTGFLEDTNI